MSKERPIGRTRRQVLAGLGVGAVTATTGCMHGGSEPEDSGTETDDTGSGDGSNGNTGGGSSSASLGDYKDWISADATDFQYIDITGVEEHFQILDSTNEDYVEDTEGTTHWNPYSLAAVGTNDVRDVEETVSVALDGTYDAARVMVVPDAEVHNAFPETGDTHQGYTLFQSDEGRAIAQDGDIIVAADNMQHLEKMLDTRHGDEPAVMSTTHDQQYFRQLVDALETHGGQGQIINGRPINSSFDYVTKRAYGNSIDFAESEMVGVGVFEEGSNPDNYREEIDSTFPGPTDGDQSQYETEGNIAIFTTSEISNVTGASNRFLLNPNYE